MGAAGVLLPFNFPLRSNGQRVRTSLSGKKIERGLGGGVRLREIVNAVIPSLREKTLVVQKCWDFITVAVNFC